MNLNDLEEMTSTQKAATVLHEFSAHVTLASEYAEKQDEHPLIFNGLLFLSYVADAVADTIDEGVPELKPETDSEEEQ